METYILYKKINTRRLEIQEFIHIIIDQIQLNYFWAFFLFYLQ